LGKIATNILAIGSDWSVHDVVCDSGPQDKPFEEQHCAATIAVVVEGSFQYRSDGGSAVLSPGALLLGNGGAHFECRHEHGTGDRCLAFRYTPEFFEKAGLPDVFPVHSIPPITTLTPLVVEARFAIQTAEQVALEELAHGLADSMLDVLGKSRRPGCALAPADERRISATLRFIEVHLTEPLPLEHLAATAKLSEFHFLRVFRQVTGVTPHQYVLRARLREAALRLKTRRDAVLEIALDTGFRDLSNFNHAFRNEFGSSPVAYRLRTHR
jgi:AraC family transcriptional regulator